MTLTRLGVVTPETLAALPGLIRFGMGHSTAEVVRELGATAATPEVLSALGGER